MNPPHVLPSAAMLRAPFSSALNRSLSQIIHHGNEGRVVDLGLSMLRHSPDAEIEMDPVKH